MSSGVPPSWEGRRADLAAGALGLCVLLLDYGTGKDVLLPVTFAIPVLLAAWRGRGWAAYALAVGLPLVSLVYHLSWRGDQTLALGLLNAGIKLTTLLVIAHLVIVNVRQSRRIRVLEGILPTCAACKNIRDAQGTYVPIERYIAERTEASFSHTICPACARRLYPDFAAPADES